MNQQKNREQAVLQDFIRVWCRGQQHSPAHEELCDDCIELETYALEKLARCPFDPKPRCKDCEVHCYRDEYREKIRNVMKYAGMHYVKRGRVDWLVKYFL